MSMTLTVASIQAPPPTGENRLSRPEFYRLPKPGEGDPYFGLTRAHYYDLEKRGKLKLVRLRRPGAERGVTLVPYAKVAALVYAAQEEQQPGEHAGSVLPGEKL